jgi:NDP-sugar pyrophosphorylase family protein
MKILIPMAGEGSRFVKEGYTFPKPLIDVNGKPMIQRVVENLNFDAEYIFLVRKEHLLKYEGLYSTLQRISSEKFKIVEVDGLTEGAACTALLAKSYINNDDDLLIANSDQLIEYSPKNFEYLKNFSSVDGIVFCFNAVHPKWSFVKVNKDGIVTEVAEKNPISDIATCGIYWYRKGKDFVNYAEKMISKNIRVNNEFYIAPVYNELIKNNKKLIPFYVQKMHGIGTPEDLQTFLLKEKTNEKNNI